MFDWSRSLGVLMPRVFKCLLGPAFFLLALNSPATAQNQPPPQSAPAQQPANSGVTTLRASTQLVVVDVVVTDSKQNPIHDLKTSDFTLLEKNVPQQIKNFEEHKSLPAAEAAKLQPIPKLPAGVFTNYSPIPVSHTLNVLLLDTLNTPLKDQAFVRDQLRKYLNSAPPGDRIAIFGLSTRLYLLQGFTSDPETLKAAINQKNLKSSPLLDDAVGGGTGLESLSDMMSSFGDSLGMAQAVANVQQFEAETSSFQLQLRARYTLDALNQLARGLSGIPGRKNLIWFSGSFPINILPDGDIQNPFAVVASAEDEFRETTNLLTASQVAVYPIDARGLMTAPMYNAANSGKKYVSNPTAFAKDLQKFSQQTADEHSTMLQMAEETGGRAFINTNDLSHAVTQAIEAGSNYYTLYYSPTDTDWNGNFRKIQVKLRQQGYTLAYRRGYYADNPNAPLKKGSVPVTTPGTPPPLDVMRAAMMYGGPDPTQILIKVRVLPASTDTETTVAPRNVLNPESKVKGPYRRYAIDYAADPHDVRVAPQSDGTNLMGLQFVIYLYDQDGNLINVAEDKTHATLDTAGLASFRTHGIPWHQEISVPVKGTYYLRIGLHDVIGDRVGAVEVPIASVKNLAPPTPPAAQPSTPPVAPK
jgi:VWFA-related protein